MRIPFLALALVCVAGSSFAQLKMSDLAYKPNADSKPAQQPAQVNRSGLSTTTTHSGSAQHSTSTTQVNTYQNGNFSAGPMATTNTTNGKPRTDGSGGFDTDPSTRKSRQTTGVGVGGTISK